MHANTPLSLHVLRPRIQRMSLCPRERGRAGIQSSAREKKGSRYLIRPVATAPCGKETLRLKISTRAFAGRHGPSRLATTSDWPVDGPNEQKSFGVMAPLQHMPGVSLVPPPKKKKKQRQVEEVAERPGCCFRV